MSASIACRASQPRRSLTYKATTLIAVITAMTFAASGAAPTMLYQRYQETFGLTPFILTIIFGAYALSLLGALLTVGSLSDYIGRRPAILAALSLNVAAMVMFISANSAAALIAARAVQGFATGRHCNARRRDHGHRPQPRAGVEQHHHIYRPDRGQPGRRCAGYLRARSAATRLCGFARHVGGRSAAPLVHSGDRHAEGGRARVASASCQRASSGAARTRACDTHHHRFMGAELLLLLADALACPRRDRDRLADRRRTCRQRLDVQRGDRVGASHPVRRHHGACHGGCTHPSWRPDAACEPDVGRHRRRGHRFWRGIFRLDANRDTASRGA